MLPYPQPRPALGAPGRWHFPVPGIFHLSNGLTVWAFDLPGQLVVSAQVMLAVPLALEEREHEGVATLALRGCDERTRDHPGVAFAEAIEAHGATMGGTAGLWGTTIGLAAPVTRLRGALGLFAEAITQPLYEEDDVARGVALRLTEIDQLRANPGASVALGVRAALASPQSRFSRANGGNPATVAALTAEHVRAFHDRFWRPHEATLIIAGELPGDLEAVVEETFGVWSALDPAPRPSVPATCPASGERAVWLLDFPEAVQATIRFGALTPTRQDPLWPGAQVASAALGGAFGSRLNAVLREERGFTYGAGCSFAPSPDKAMFSVHANCRADVAVEATVTALRLMDLKEAALTRAEVDDAVTYLVGVAPLQYDTAEAIAAQAGALAQAGLPSTWLDQHHARLRAVTPDQATAAFADWIDPAALHIVIAGPAAQLLGPLRAAGLDAQIVDLAG